MRFFAVVAAGVLLVACGHTTPVRPVPRGAVQVEFAAGGPVLEVAGVVTSPLPLSTVGVRYGHGERHDLSAHVHLTALTFGVAGLDVGSTYLPIAQSVSLRQACGPAT